MSEQVLSTYRMQFRPEFTLDDAAGTVPYLRTLGVSHLYASPYLQAAPGSTHGYDVVNYGAVNSELGGAAAHHRLVEALRENGLGQILDIVPNHMAISPENPWWWDVLQNGPSSRYAGYFDVEWNPPEARHQDVVMLPVLGDQYGRELDAGKIQLFFEDLAFTVRYYDFIYPVDPQTVGGLLSAAAERIHNNTLTFLGGAYDRLPVATATDRASANRRYRDTEVLDALLARMIQEQPGVGAAIQDVVAAVNKDPDTLDAFLRRQNYRPAFWQISARELGYRRFFDINTMIGLRMEDEDVYHDTHALVLSWLERGVLDGLRIDHVDGLLDPQTYLNRLRRDAPNAYIVVEKIIEPEERLPESWPIQGTTGYDFLNRVNGVLVDTAAEQPLTDFYAAFTGRSNDYAALVHEKKLLAAREVLGSDLNRLTELFLRIAEDNRCYRDYTRDTISGVLAETAACLPVYRTYVAVGPDGPLVSSEDERMVGEAIEKAKANRPDIDPRLFDFFHDLLLLRERGAAVSELALRFQQFSGPVMAKGVEDTVFYIYNRFISLNEVGGDPGRFGLPVEAFHRACQETQARWPLAMLATSTHDTKRSEDVRARLNVLSEMPEAWAAAVRRWSEMNEAYRVEREGPTVTAGERKGAAKAAPAISDASKGPDQPDLTGETRPDNHWPDRNAEYLLYQTLVGAWPVEEDRVQQYMEKAGREGKEFTSWTAPNKDYEAAVKNFIHEILADQRFTADLSAFVDTVRETGWINGLSQALIKLTTPGVPDIYQGCDLWSFALVDPDNRRPVDYALRQELLAALEKNPAPEAIWQRAESGLPKLWVTRQALALRRGHPDWFGAQSSYTPIPVDRDAGIAFLRADRLAVVVPRLVTCFRREWDSLSLTLPGGTWQNALTQERVQGGRATLGGLLKRFPVALLIRQ